VSLVSRPPRRKSLAPIRTVIASAWSSFRSLSIAACLVIPSCSLFGRAALRKAMNDVWHDFERLRFHVAAGDEVEARRLAGHLLEHLVDPAIVQEPTLDSDADFHRHLYELAGVLDSFRSVIGPDARSRQAELLAEIEASCDSCHARFRE
jgi:hypothetical protein